MIENFTTSSKGSETSKNSEKKSFELYQNSNEYLNIRYIRFSPIKYQNNRREMFSTAM